MQYVYRRPWRAVQSAYLRPRYFPSYTGQWFYDPVTEQQITLGTVVAASPFFGVTPTVASGDIWVARKVTSPDSYPITLYDDGTASYAANNDISCQRWLNKIFDTSAGAFYETDEVGDYFTISVNNSNPLQIAAITAQQWWTNVAITPVRLTGTRFSDPEGDPLSFSFSVSLPTGISVQLHTENAGQPDEISYYRIEGTPAAGQEGDRTHTPTVTDGFGGSLTATAFDSSTGIGIQIPDDDNGDVDFETALENLDAAEFATAFVTPVISGSVTIGNVVTMTPPGGSYAPPGSAVGLTVSGVTRPNVVGQQRADAETAIGAVNLVAVVELRNTTTHAAGEVMSQDPPGDTPAIAGTIVNLVVARAYPVSLVETIRRDVKRLNS